MIDRVSRTCGLPSLALLVTLAVVAIGCSAAVLPSASGTRSASGAPAIASDGPIRAVATPTPPPGAAASMTFEPIASASASSAAIPDGDYVSGVITHATAETLLKDPKIANDAGVKSFLAEFTTTLVSTLRLKNPSWVQLEREDGQDKGVGARGTYAFADAHTIVYEDSVGCNETLGFSMHGESLKLTVVTDSCGPGDAAVGRVIFESTAWTRTP